MPIKPKAITCVCPKCNWIKTVKPQSDCLVSGEYFNECPKCGNQELVTRQPTTLEEVTVLILKNTIAGC